MYPFTLQKIGQYLGQSINSQALISNITIDSRTACAGSLFIALPGNNVDGHQFVEHVLSNGGYAIVKQGYETEHLERVIVVSDPLHALQQLATAHLKFLKIPVVAVTGSNGKTTTKDLIASVLDAKYSVHKTQGNFNNEIGLPLTVLELEQNHEIVVLEMGMRGLGQITNLTKIAPPNVSVITNVGPVHLELLGSMEHIARAKSEILAGMNPEGLAVLNGDDQYVCQYASTVGKVIFYGKGIENDLYARDIEVDHNGSVTYNLVWQSKKHQVFLPFPGIHNVYNSLAAIGVGLHFKIPIEQCIAALRDVSLSKMRLEIIPGVDDIRVINDAYNASPASMQAALDTLAVMENAGRKIAVLGDMLELGTISHTAHEQVAVNASKICDLLVFVGKYCSIMKKAAVKAGFSPTQIRIYPQADDAAAEINSYIIENDLILVKASRSVALEQVVEVLAERQWD